MGFSPESCVVNRCSRLWHAPNVSVTDVSTFPENESANPMLPILVLTRQEIRDHAQNL
jgi:choline dehydrogenase-like flavoprotein